MWHLCYMCDEGSDPSSWIWRRRLATVDFLCAASCKRGLRFWGASSFGKAGLLALHVLLEKSDVFISNYRWPAALTACVHGSPPFGGVLFFWRDLQATSPCSASAWTWKVSWLATPGWSSVQWPDGDFMVRTPISPSTLPGHIGAARVVSRESECCADISEDVSGFWARSGAAASHTDANGYPAVLAPGFGDMATGLAAVGGTRAACECLLAVTWSGRTFQAFARPSLRGRRLVRGWCWAPACSARVCTATLGPPDCRPGL